MSYLRLLKITIVLGVFSLVVMSCFKDVDFEQAQEIQLSPDLQVDLLYYNVNKLNFTNSGTNEFTPVIRDTVRLEFLDDDYIQEDLMFAELRFRHENKFPYSIRNKIKFLSANDRTQFSVNYDIPPGSMDAIAVVDTLRILETNEIGKLRRSIKMFIELELIDGGKDPEGELNFSSKGLFKFEF